MSNNDEQLKFDVSQLIIFNQLCLEANDRMRAYPKLYRHRLKNAVNTLEKELEKLMDIYDDVYPETSDFLLTTQKQIQQIVPTLRKMRIDELATLPFLIEAYKTDREATEQFLSKTLNKELI